jgi:predicted O-methyltransferase YrrM
MDDSLQSLLRELERFGAENDARASQRSEKMLNITPDTGELLAILAQGIKARRVLEIGTSNGYSTIWLADAMKAVSGTVITVELSAAKAEMARQNVKRAGLAKWVQQEVMDAGEFLREHPAEQLDMLFLDANRGHYLAWWPSIQRVLAPGGLLVVDNAVSHAGEIESFIAQVRATAGWRSVVVPIGNGELIALKPNVTAS